MARIHNWPETLHEYFLARATASFAWGSHDCCTFAADGVLAITGIDIAADFRGYTTKAGALRAIKKITGGTTAADAVAYAAQKHGLPELEHPLTAQRGDLVLVDENGELLCGLVHLNGSDVVVAGENGPLRKPITDVTRAWRV